MNEQHGKRFHDCMLFIGRMRESSGGFNNSCQTCCLCLSEEFYAACLRLGFLCGISVD